MGNNDTVLFRGQDATIEIEDDDGENEPVAIIDDITISADKDIEELRGMGSTLWQDVQEVEAAFEISAEIASAGEKFFEKLVGYDLENGEYDDSSDVPFFEVTGVFQRKESVDGEIDKKEITFEDVYFEDPEMAGAMDDWIGYSIEGRARTIKEINNPSDPE